MFHRMDGNEQGMPGMRWEQGGIRMGAGKSNSQTKPAGGRKIHKNPTGSRDGLKKDKSGGIRVERSSGDHEIQPGFRSRMSENQHG